MKFINKFVLPIITTALLSSCSQGDFVRSGEKDFKAFNNALSLTSSLLTYSINLTTIEDETTTTEKKVLSQNEDESYTAYYKLNGVESYWINGFSYEIDEGNKVKIAKSLDTFLHNSSESLTLTYQDVKSSFSKSNNTYRFDLDKEGFDKVTFVCKVKGYFVTDISATFFLNKIETKKVTYSYENPGSNPTIKLPADLESYTY